MARGSGGDDPTSGDDGGGLFGPDALDALAEAEADDLLALGAAVLAELKDRGLLRILLRNRSDAATAFEVEAIRAAEDGLDLVAAGYHAETPEDYPAWVEEAAALAERLQRPGLPEPAAEALLGAATDEALLLTLESARFASEDGDDRVSLPAPDSRADSLEARVALELLRRGIIEPDDAAGPG